jgi:endonuclease/exonuclease/phosphatase family metal-dependent hydrolase
LLGALVGEGRAETLTIATYNVENYTATDRMTADGYRQNYPKPEVQKQALRQVLLRLKADLVVLQEMGSSKYLDELVRDLKRDGLDYPQSFVLEAADKERHLAVISRRKIDAIVPHPVIEFPYFGGHEKVKRGLLELSLKTSIGTLTIYGVHLKSRFTDRPDDPRSSVRRDGEATTIRDMIFSPSRAVDGTRCIVLGDFNDDRVSKPLQRFLKRGKTSLLESLPAVDSRGETWTHLFRKEETYSRVDHVLVSTEVLPYVKGRAVIEDGAGVTDASDHRPVFVTLEFPDKK